MQKKTFPDFVPPMMAQSIKEPFDSGNAVFIDGNNLAVENGRMQFLPSESNALRSGNCGEGFGPWMRSAAAPDRLCKFHTSDGVLAGLVGFSSNAFILYPKGGMEPDADTVQKPVLHSQVQRPRHYFDLF
jgi:hypothetical protein